MGDENSLAGVTKSHKHSAPSSDGGFLETTVTGVTNLSEGSIVYGNASEIVTELPSGTDGDSLVLSSGLPAWSGGGGSTWEQVFSDTIGSNSNVVTNTFTGIDQDDYSMFCLNIQCGINEDSDILMQFHDSTGVITSGYSTSGIAVTGGSPTYIDSAGENFARLNKFLGHKCYIVTVFITMGNSNLTDGENKRFSWWSTFSSGGGADAMFSTQGGNCDKDSVTSLNGLTLYANAVSGANTFQTGSKFTLWKIT